MSDVAVFDLYSCFPAAVKVAEKLRAAGFKRVRPLHGGIDAWIEAGLDVER